MEHIVLAHGLDSFIGWDTPLGPLEWNAADAVFSGAGYVTHKPSLGNDNPTNAQIIKDMVDAIPFNETVYIVSHSMGGLSSRWYLKYLGGAVRVTSYIALDTPQTGTWDALNPFKWEPQITPVAPFIKTLNTPDATPGTLPYVQLTCQYPTLLPGVLYKAFPTLTHKTMVTDPNVLALVLLLLSGDFSALQVN